MTTGRPYFATKAEWAASLADGARRDAERLRLTRIPSANWRAVRAKMKSIAHLVETAARYDRLAAGFVAKGL